MCQLLGMNANTPTDINFSFTGFCQRGGATDQHRDGFGIAFFERSASGVGLRVFHDHQASAQSPIADLIQRYPIKAMNVIAHIRKASQGQVCLTNTHPFVREIWGEAWVFAHNGQLQSDFLQHLPAVPEVYRPIGNTDSEALFCYLLNALRARFPEKPESEALFAFIYALCQQVSAYGLLNVLLSNGAFLWAFAGSLLFYLTRQAPFGKALLTDRDVTIDFRDCTTEHDRVTILVTVPLTQNEAWQQLAVGEGVAFHNGAMIFQARPERPHYLSIEEGLAIARRYGTGV